MKLHICYSVTYSKQAFLITKEQNQLQYLLLCMNEFSNSCSTYLSNGLHGDWIPCFDWSTWGQVINQIYNCPNLQQTKVSIARAKTLQK